MSAAFVMVGNDLDLSSGNLVITENLAVIIAQTLTVRFQLFLGEWFMDSRVGVPFFQVVFVKNPNMVVINQLFRNVILKTPGVASIIDQSMTFISETRTPYAFYKVQTKTGAIIQGGPGQPFIVSAFPPS
jgi:hypothetical protein